MATYDEKELRRRLEEAGQAHVVQFWSRLSGEEQAALGAQIAGIDFELMGRLIEEWVLKEPAPEQFERIDPVPLIERADAARPDSVEAKEAGEWALRTGRVGLLLVAGGQGTRLGFDGPKGAYPIGPVSGRSLFAYHADKVRNVQRRYGCVLPWYIMVSETNEAATRAYFRANGYFGLHEGDIVFFRQRMIPCVDDAGKFMLESPGRLAMNPNGHGGVIPAVVENGIAKDARDRGVDTLSYFQVDNWAVRLADPYFLGYHVSRHGEMSSKVVAKNGPRESVGVHCLCDGEYRVIEYSELDIYPQLLEADATGRLLHPAGNPAMHTLSVGFIERMHREYARFPWHRAHKKIAFVDSSGAVVKPERPNGFKFETFVFDALRFIEHEPIALLIRREGEYTPIKQFEGDNSVTAARRSMARYWGGWLEEAGYPVPRDDEGAPVIQIEISPDFALTKNEFVRRSAALALPEEGDIAIDADGILVGNA